MMVITTHNKASKEVAFWDKEPIKGKILQDWQKGKRYFHMMVETMQELQKEKKAMKVIIAHDQSWSIECTSLPSIVEHP
jgi:hypothetical protein